MKKELTILVMRKKNSVSSGILYRYKYRTIGTYTNINIIQT